MTILSNLREKGFKYHNLEDYDIHKQNDPFARESFIVKRSRFFRQKLKQDGDIWFETVFRNVNNGKARIYFVSQKTGTRRRDEPPSGASLVVYLRSSVRAARLQTRKVT